MRFCLKEGSYCLRPCASTYPCGSNLFNDSSSASWRQFQIHCILPSITNTFGILSVLKVAIEEQDFSSVQWSRRKSIARGGGGLY